MARDITVKDMQEAIMTLHLFADNDDYTLCRPYLKGLVKGMADTLESIISARDWEPVYDD